ncbi:MAG: radical SAM protein, partial [Desulfuromonas sp.]
MENQRFLIPLDDGLSVEAVYYGSGTLCLSSQAGCALRCAFCASGRLGLRRNLTLAELSLQLQHAQGRGITPKRLTLSGIGEPLHNAETVIPFLAQCREKGIPLSLTTTGCNLLRLAEILPL